MSIDEFIRLFKYMEKRFDQIDKALEQKAEKSDVDRIMSMLDALTKRQQIGEDERLVIRHQLEQLDQSTHQLADKINWL